MEPLKVKELPISYPMDKELLRLLSEANEKYGEYKSYLKNLEFDSKLFLNSIILNDSLKSTQIEGTQISQDEMYYLKYLPQTDDNLEIQNWVGPRGCTIEEAIFVPPIPEDVPLLLDNLYKYMNDAYVDPTFINLAISHSQFETIHAYRDGNGRLGRALISIQLALLTEDVPILFLSEILEVYRPSYHRLLNESRKGNMLGFIKFFLQCIIEQCNNYILKINRIRQIYKRDMEKIKVIRGSSIYRIMPVIMKQIIFTKSEIVQETGISRNIVSTLIDKLTELGILEKDTTYLKKGYRYKEIYDVFVAKEF